MKTKLLWKIQRFLDKIGIEMLPAKLPDDTFLPGIAVENGKLLFDTERLRYPGDLLHEAGHLAVVPAALRSGVNGEIEISGSFAEILEIEAIAWSYAACLYLKIDPKIVFHSDGYKGKAAALLFNFDNGIFFGIENLEEAGLTLTPATAANLGEKPYPEMIKWCKD